MQRRHKKSMCSHFCAVSPRPDVAKAIREEVEKARSENPALRLFTQRSRKALGMDDGLLLPPHRFPIGTSAREMRRYASDRYAARARVRREPWRLVVLLVDFEDAPIARNRAHFEQLFFGVGNNSVRDYFREVSRECVDIVGDVFGPFRLPEDLTYYANGESGLSASTPNTSTMAKHAVEAATAAVDFSQYDNDWDGAVDGLVIVHADTGAETTKDAAIRANRIWSVKWSLDGGALPRNGVDVFAFMTVPEDARIGVCCHELGHLVFGWPDLYDSAKPKTWSGLDSWCLMSSGSWNGGGDTPAHPSAYCKVLANWVPLRSPTHAEDFTLEDAERTGTILRLGPHGKGGPEYFLAENRQRIGFDAKLPGSGLVVYHIDENVDDNTNELHPLVGVMQADDKQDLQVELAADAGDPYPGTKHNKTFDGSSSPNSDLYSGAKSCVSITQIQAVGTQIKARVASNCATGGVGKNWRKDMIEKWVIEKGGIGFEKHPEKPQIDKMNAFDKNGLREVGNFGADVGLTPFIGRDLRPALLSPQDMAAEELRAAVEGGVPGAKRLLDGPGWRG